MRSPRTATKSSPCSPQLERKPACSNEDPTQPKKQNKTKPRKMSQTKVSVLRELRAKREGLISKGIRKTFWSDWVVKGHSSQSQRDASVNTQGKKKIHHQPGMQKGEISRCPNWRACSVQWEGMKQKVLWKHGKYVWFLGAGVSESYRDESWGHRKQTPFQGCQGMTDLSMK